MKSNRILAVFVGIGLLSGCATTNPLSISLYNPKTNMIRKCAARTSDMQQSELLAGIVETCARQLEAHGFVRVNDSFVPPKSLLNTDAPASASDGLR
jgi:hypothetical protein